MTLRRHRPTIPLLALLVLLGPLAAHAEPRELLLEGEPIGAIAVDPPPEWVPARAEPADPALGRAPDTLNAWLTHDGPWVRSLMPHGGPERPYGKPITLTLGRPVESVPHPPSHTLRPLALTLETPSGRALGEFRCPTTEVLAEAPDGRWQVRLYRTGPNGERYVLTGLTSQEPTPGDCGQRVAWVDTGHLPAGWVRVPAQLPAFTAAPFWWVRDGRCARFAWSGGHLVSRHTTREGRCLITTTERFEAERHRHQVVLGQWSSSTQSSCGDGLGAAGSGQLTTYRLVAADSKTWRWVIQRPHQDPVAYHPDDVGLWFKSRRACEASLSNPTPR